MSPSVPNSAHPISHSSSRSVYAVSVDRGVRSRVFRVYLQLYNTLIILPSLHPRSSGMNFFLASFCPHFLRGSHLPSFSHYYVTLSHSAADVIPNTRCHVTCDVPSRVFLATAAPSSKFESGHHSPPELLHLVLSGAISCNIHRYRHRTVPSTHVLNHPSPQQYVPLLASLNFAHQLR